MLIGRLKTRQIRYEKGQIRKHHISTNFAPALQRPPIPRPPVKAVPPLGTSAAATAPSQLALRRRRYRLPEHMPSFHRFKLRQGVKWMIRRRPPSSVVCDLRLAAIATAPGRA
jgi:hypothetical protein